MSFRSPGAKIPIGRRLRFARVHGFAMRRSRLLLFLLACTLAGMPGRAQDAAPAPAAPAAPVSPPPAPADAAVPAPAAPVPAGPPREYIVVSGGPALRFFENGKQAAHDFYWGNFIRSASIRLKQIVAEKGPNDRVSWLVFRPGYDRRGTEMNVDLLAEITKLADQTGVALYWFDTTQELFNYLNAGQNRNQLPIADFEFFGHSNKACFMFDYSNDFDSMAQFFLHAKDLTRIDPKDFAKDAKAKSWGCHSGEYFSAIWKQQLGFPMTGAIGKTDYSNGALPFLSSEGGQWSE
jgi:hypothetical protein